MEMTFQQYIDNPLGKKNAVFSQRDLFRTLYTDKFDKVLLREVGKINYTLYLDKKHDKYVIHIKVPSETVNKFYYDAVIYFYTDDPATNASTNLNNYKVKFFSNDPAFVFTYLRVFLKNDMFFEDLKPKVSKLALTKDPVEKNPYEIPGYSKILYFAYLYMKNKNLFNKYLYQETGRPYSAKELLSHIDHTDKKIADRQELGEKIAKDKAKAARDERKKSNVEHIAQVNKFNDKQQQISGVAKVKAIGKTPTSSQVKKTQTTSTVKRTKRG